MSKQYSPEEETLEKIKFFLLCNNEGSAIRAIEQYGYWKQEQMYSKEHVLSFLKQVIEHPNKPGYKRRDVLDLIDQIKKQ